MQGDINVWFFDGEKEKGGVRGDVKETNVAEGGGENTGIVGIEIEYKDKGAEEGGCVGKQVDNIWGCVRGIIIK